MLTWLAMDSTILGWSPEQICRFQPRDWRALIEVVASLRSWSPTPTRANEFAVVLWMSIGVRARSRRRTSFGWSSGGTDVFVERRTKPTEPMVMDWLLTVPVMPWPVRSEERRVGKEG